MTLSALLCVLSMLHEYRKSFTKQARLVKPGGTLLMQTDENVPSWGIPSKTFTVLSMFQCFLS